jgi:NAD(P)H-nitrite reductase large subunit
LELSLSTKEFIPNGIWFSGRKMSSDSESEFEHKLVQDEHSDFLSENALFCECNLVSKAEVKEVLTNEFGKHWHQELSKQEKQLKFFLQEKTMAGRGCGSCLQGPLSGCGLDSID